MHILPREKGRGEEGNGVKLGVKGGGIGGGGYVKG